MGGIGAGVGSSSVSSVVFSASTGGSHTRGVPVEVV